MMNIRTQMTRESISRSSFEKHNNIFKHSATVGENRHQSKSGEDPSAKMEGYTEENIDINQDQNTSNVDYDTDQQFKG